MTGQQPGRTHWLAGDGTTTVLADLVTVGRLR
jgi:hypothetical protein